MCIKIKVSPHFITSLINVQLISFPSGIRSIGYLVITSIKPQDRAPVALHCLLLITARWEVKNVCQTSPCNGNQGADENNITCKCFTKRQGINISDIRVTVSIGESNISILFFGVLNLTISYQYKANAFNLKQLSTNVFSFQGTVAKREIKCNKNGSILVCTTLE